MKRREFMTLVGGVTAATALPCAAYAQQAARVRRLGFLCLGLSGDDFGRGIAAAFTEGLTASGWNEGFNLRIDWRWYGADAALADKQAEELLAAGPDVFLAGGNPAVEVLRRRTNTVPVVFSLVSDPVGMGYVDSLAHPGGNITGFQSLDPPIYTKQLQFLTEIMPPASTVAAIYNPQTAPFARRMLQAVQLAAKSMGVDVRDSPCQSDQDIEATIAALSKADRGGLLVLGDIFTQVHRYTITRLALMYKIPTVVNTRQLVESGGLIAYEVNVPDLFRRAAAYVDLILKGEKAIDLPVQAPIKFDLLVNLKTAKALRIGIPQALLATADEVIE